MNETTPLPDAEARAPDGKHAGAGMGDGAYVQDVPYTWSFFNYQGPLVMSYVATLNGFAAPDPKSDFTYCDLGCGNGVTVNLLAAAFPQARFVGVDFNAKHIANARGFAEAAQLENAEFVDASFADYAAAGPPAFDYIAMHGIYSWVSADVRNQIHTLIDASLKPGGLVYVSYNALPGWSELIPLWKMMQTCTAAFEGDSLSKAKFGLEQLAFLRANQARYFEQTPAASRHLDRLLARDLHYVAHEFCNDAFEPQYFIDVARRLRGLGLSYAGTAKLHRNDRRNVVAERFLDHVADAADPLEAESRQSFVRNEFFRRDIYVQGGARLDAEARRAAFDELIVGATAPTYRINPTLNLDRRQIDLTRSPFRRLVPLAASGRHSVAALADHDDMAGTPPAEVRAAVLDLLGGDQFQILARRVPDHADADPAQRYRLTSPANRTMLTRRLMTDGKAYVESAILGSALRLNLLDGLFTLGLNGRNSAEALAFATDTLQGLDRDARNRLDLARHPGDTTWIADRHEKFERRLLPVLLRYGILAPAD